MLFNTITKKEWKNSDCINCNSPPKDSGLMCECIGKTVFYMDSLGNLYCPILKTIINLEEVDSLFLVCDKKIKKEKE